MSQPFGQPPYNPYGDQQPPYGQSFGNQPTPYGQPINPYLPSSAPPSYGKPLPPGTVKNWLIESILALVCCGGLIAIPAVIFAAQVDGHLSRGDYQAAVQASNNAKLWLTIAVGVAVALNLLCVGPLILLQLMAALAGAA